MYSTSAKGNDSERWEKLISALDDKLQLGLLDYLSRIHSYHFEGDVLYIEPGSVTDAEYLKRETVRHQLELFAQDSTKIQTIVIKQV